MKKYLFLLLPLSVSLFASCDKEETPAELTSTQKISREWVVTKFEVNGFDQTATFDALFPEYSVDFNADGTYTEYYLVSGSQVPVPGTWVFLNNNTEIQMTDASQTRLYTILELSTTNFNVDNADNSDADIYYLEPK